MKNILHFGTFDVNNFGDLLFPLLAKASLSEAFETTIVPMSPAGGAPADFRDCAIPKTLIELSDSDKPYHAALIGGGNIIHCSPTQLPAYTAADKGTLAYSDLWIAPSIALPQHCPLLWNAPGVPARFMPHQRDLVRRALSAASYLSVRDEQSRQFLLEVDPSAEIFVVPDTAWNLDLLWSKPVLKKKYESYFVDNQTELPQSIVVFHLNRRYLGGLHAAQLGQELDSIAQYYDSVAVLVPFAPCHGDDILAHQVARTMNSRSIVIDNADSLQLITAFVSNAKAYIGSSMHGLITAAVYGVPGACVASLTMPKFNGLSDLVQRSDLVVENWQDASKLALSMDFQGRAADFVSAKMRANLSLQRHWSKVAEIINSQPNLEGFGIRNGSVCGQFLKSIIEYKEQGLEVLNAGQTLAKAQLEKEYSERLSAATRANASEIAAIQAAAQADLRRLRAKQLRIESSLSWRITRPLRALSSRYPHFASTIVETAKVFYRLAKRTAPSSTGPLGEAPRWSPRADIGSQIARYRDDNRSRSRKIVVYTAVFGDYDRLLLPELLDPEIDYVCFTDRPRDTFGIWKLRISPFYHADPTRIARYIKTHPHTLFSGYDHAIWIDANIILRADPVKYIRMLDAAGKSLGLVPHPHRDCVYEEIEACKLRSKDSDASLDSQATFYRSHGLEEHRGMYETGFMAVALKDLNTRSLFAAWWRQIATFSRRDQVGLAWSLKSHSVDVCELLPKGVSVREDEDFIFIPHADARRLSTPADLKPHSLIESPKAMHPFAFDKSERLRAVSERAIDIVICVHNALEDVKLCIPSVLADLRDSHNLIVVNDCSDSATTEYLRSLKSSNPRFTLIENTVNLGYTRSANKGLAAGQADFRIILNSDTVVSENWALKLLDAALRGDEIGVVGPLSNAAGVQSVPSIKSSAGNTAINNLPAGISGRDIDALLETIPEANIFPEVPLVHGFCMGIKKEVFNSIGYFDAENFSRYYGEENDFCLRAAAAGYSMALATNTFVFHRKSRSIAEEERVIHMEKAGRRLREMYGAERIREACRQGEDHPVLVALRTKVAEYVRSEGTSS